MALRLSKNEIPKGRDFEENFHILSKHYQMVGPGGLEPPTPALSRRCSNQLSYGPKICPANFDTTARGAAIGLP